MIIDFELEFAKEAQELGEGKIKTRGGEEVKITKWDTGETNYSIRGHILPESRTLSWMRDGSYYGFRPSDLDLHIEIL